MEKQQQIEYAKILKKELVRAQGCTEPIAIAYAAAKAREVLGGEPTKIVVGASGNIIKNVKSVVIPNTNGMIGIEAAAVIGALGGDSSLGLEVLKPVKKDMLVRAAKLLASKGFCSIYRINSSEKLHIIVFAENKNSKVYVEIRGTHTNITQIEKDDVILYKKQEEDTFLSETQQVNYGLLTVDGIIDFANTCEIELVKDTIEQQIECNTRISKEGLRKNYGANVGRTLRKHNGESVQNRAKYTAAAGSDARMNGCLLPVVINSGSGNQGITVTMPVLEYGRELEKSHEEIIRALLVSNLVSIHLKHQIGSLSAFCGAVSAGCGSGAAITYLRGGSPNQIKMTIMNTLGDTSGLFCDGAKSSCAAKIATAVDAAINASDMAMDGFSFANGEGIVGMDAEKTLQNVARIASQGMNEVDDIILEIMVNN